MIVVPTRLEGQKSNHEIFQHLMKITSGLNKQIFLALAVVGLLPLLVMALQNHYFARKVIEESEKEHMNMALRSRLLWLRTWLSDTRKDFYQLAFNVEPGKKHTEEDFRQVARKIHTGAIAYRAVSIYRPDWSLLSSYPENLPREVYLPPEEYRKRLLVPGELFVVGEEFLTAGNDVIMPVGQAMLNPTGGVEGIVVAEVNLTHSLERVLSDTSDLNNGGRYVLATDDGRILYSSWKNKEGEKEHGATRGKRTGRDFVPEDVLTAPAYKVMEKCDCFIGDDIYYVSAPIPEFDWQLIVHIPATSALQRLNDYIHYGIITALITLLLLALLTVNLSRRIATPLDNLTRVARRISAGQHKERLPPFKEVYAQEVGEAFNMMMDTLEEQQRSMIQTTALSRVGEMNSSLIHEMRNPLSSVKLNLQALARKVKNDETYAEMASIALAQVSRLEEMFADLLKFSKPLEIHRQPLTFAELVREVVTTLKPEADKKKIRLQVEDMLKNSPFLADREHSCRALSNLVSNAIQWSDSGELVTISGRQAGREKGEIMICVADRGPGLRQEHVEKLFQPFFTTREHGTGLGLANVKKIMDYQGGAVLARNRPDGGAVFSLLFRG